MGIVSHAVLIGDDFDFANATASDVCFAFIIHLPFRFRVKSPFHIHFELRGNAYDLWIVNTTDVSGSENILSSLYKQGKKITELWSSAAIIQNKSNITDKELKILQTCGGDTEKLAFHSRSKQLLAVTQALNSFIVGYQGATGELFGGHALRTIPVSELADMIVWEISLIGIARTEWNAETVPALFDPHPALKLKTGATLTGELTDLSAETLSGITDAIERASNFYFYELVFEAKAKMAGGDIIGALLLAVAALEGVHGALVTHLLERLLPADRTGDDKSLEDNFLKELGFSLCNRLTPYLFMKPEDRPDKELIRNAATAITYRNEIMHALRNSAGNYRIRTRSNADVCDAYSAAIKLYDHYRKAFENMRKPE